MWVHMLALLQKKQQQQQSNKQHSVKLTMNVVTEITVPGFLLQHSSTRFPNFEKKNQKIFKTYTKASDGT